MRLVLPIAFILGGGGRSPAMMTDSDTADNVILHVDIKHTIFSGVRSSHMADICKVEDDWAAIRLRKIGIADNFRH